MSFPTFNLFMTIKSDSTTNFGCLDTLTINNSKAWFFVTTSTFANHLPKYSIHLFKRAIIAPFFEVIVDGAIIRKIAGEQIP